MRKDPRTPPQQERDAGLINFVQQHFTNPWKAERKPWVQQFLVNHYYYNGHQFIQMQGGVVSRRRRRAREVQIAHNHFLPAARVVLGQVTKNKPVMDLRALRSGFVPEAEMISGRRILRGLQYSTQKQHIDQQGWMHGLKGGTWGKRVMWDKNGGQYGEHTALDDEGNELHRDLKDGKVRSDPEVTDIIVKMLEKRFAGEEIPTGAEQMAYAERFTPEVELRYEGAIHIDVYNCCEFATDQGYWDLKEADMLLIERWRSQRFIEKTWPDIGKAVVPEHDVPLLYDTSGFSSYLPGASLARTIGPESHIRDRCDGAVVRELIIKPTKLNPISYKIRPGGSVDMDSDLKPAEKGVHLVWANNVVLQGREDDFSDAPMPYFETPGTDNIDANFDMSDYRWMTEPCFNGTPMFTSAVPLQNAINARRGAMIAHINSHAYAKLLMPRGSQVRESAFANQAGEVVDYMNTPPSYLDPPSMPAGLFRMLDDDTKQFNDVLMLHEVSREGRVPPSVRTASALIRLQETDNLALAPIMLRYEESEQTTAQMILDRANQFYETGRLVQFIGETNQMEVEEFKRGELFQGRVNVYVHEGSSIPDSLAANMQMLFDFLQYAPMMFMTKEGGFDRARVARLINIPAFDQFLQDEDESRQAAEYENSQMDSGVWLDPLATDEDAVHLQSHYRIIRSPDFRKKPQEIQDMMNQHAAIHEQRMFQKIQTMMGVSQHIGGQAQGAAEDQDRQQMAQGQQQPAPDPRSTVDNIAGEVKTLMESAGL